MLRRHILLLAALALSPVGCAQQPSSSSYARAHPPPAILPAYVPAQELAAAKTESGFYPALTAPSERETTRSRYPAYKLNERHVQRSTLEEYRSRNVDDIARIEAALDGYRRGAPFGGCLGAQIHECVAGLSARHVVSTSHTGELIRRPKRDIVGTKDGTGVMFSGTIYPISDVRTGRDIFRREKIDITVYAGEDGIVGSMSFSFEDGRLTWAKTDAEFQDTHSHELFRAAAGTSCEIGEKEFHIALYTDLLRSGRRDPDRFYDSPDSISRVRTTHYRAKEPICGLRLSYDIWEQRSASRTSSGETDRYTLWLRGGAPQRARGSTSASPKSKTVV